MLLFTRWRRVGTRPMAASLVLMALAVFLPLGTLLEHLLESRRATVIARLARAYQGAHHLFGRRQGREADYLYPLLDSFGVPRARVELESRARNTYENAVLS